MVSSLFVCLCSCFHTMPQTQICPGPRKDRSFGQAGQANSRGAFHSIPFFLILFYSIRMERFANGSRDPVPYQMARFVFPRSPSTRLQHSQNAGCQSPHFVFGQTGYFAWAQLCIIIFLYEQEHRRSGRCPEKEAQVWKSIREQIHCFHSAA